MTTKTWRRWRRLAVFVLVAYPTALLTGACGAVRRSAPLASREREVAAQPPLQYTVSVVPWDEATARRLNKDADAYANSLLELLSASHAFRTVRLERQPRPDTDLVATSTGLYCNSAVIPLFTIVSLGIVPTISDDESCQGMVLHSATRPEQRTAEIVSRATNRVVIGWAALPLRAREEWTSGTTTDPDYADHFRAAIFGQREQIERLGAGG